MTLRTPDPTLSIVFVSNGPGELSTWVRPLAEALHRELLLRPRAPQSALSLSLVLVPCPNATGQEADAASRWSQFERIIPARQFWSLLLRPQRFGRWPSQGVVVFLGGDQFWTVLLSARLGYRHITYAEWVARWPRWNDRIAAMAPSVRDQLPRRFRSRCEVVGDLMADLSSHARAQDPLPEGWAALLPGSSQPSFPSAFLFCKTLTVWRPSVWMPFPAGGPTTSVEELLRYLEPSNAIAASYVAGIQTVLPPEMAGHGGVCSPRQEPSSICMKTRLPMACSVSAPSR